MIQLDNKLYLRRNMVNPALGHICTLRDPSVGFITSRWMKGAEIAAARGYIINNTTCRLTKFGDAMMKMVE